MPAIAVKAPAVRRKSRRVTALDSIPEVEEASGVNEGEWDTGVSSVDIDVDIERGKTVLASEGAL
jgi:hypothetical protein